ncbi:serine/threonine-protein kinase RsbW [Ruminiclostridium sufflavum DSM 19573]|uniref:Serine/threonine-protein kinase RsbW n=1 Tax=Ruminiclostridium sufflavum DSM 19573 TaxID=1121337 RepID=A0A318XKS5_9FIRM|nr:ATP-binding protein [Ruminiclostridium sufflavum]PYG88118.1 serine/threonine-protein kinase RsbW [Ruminiclostridium sufflavum DSM 19573]
MKAVTYTIKQDVKALSGTIDLMLCDIMSEHIMSDEIVFEIRVVLNELITNAFCHGNKCECGKVAFVTFKVLRHDYLYLSVKDEGRGFDPEIKGYSKADYLEEANKLLCEHGRGLVIVDSLCNRIKFNKCGNKVSVLKYLQ